MAAVEHVLIVEDHTLIAHALADSLRLSGIGRVDVLDSASLAGDRVLAAVDSDAPDLVLLDLHLGGGVDGLPLIEPIRVRRSMVIVLTGSSESWKHGEAFEAGASDVIEKSAPFEEMLRAVKGAGGGPSAARRRDDALAALHAHRAEHAHRLATFHDLSHSEQMVLRQMVEGLSVEAIAARRGVGKQTVRTQVQAVLRKLGVGTQLAAVAAARAAGWPE